MTTDFANNIATGATGCDDACVAAWLHIYLTQHYADAYARCCAVWDADADGGVQELIACHLGWLDGSHPGHLPTRVLADFKLCNDAAAAALEF